MSKTGTDLNEVLNQLISDTVMLKLLTLAQLRGESEKDLVRMSEEVSIRVKMAIAGMDNEDAKRNYLKAEEGAKHLLSTLITEKKMSQ
ncbi:hypothetical protein V2E67_002831 [Citrobacter freundii]|nr:hypothetical protein [Citrobacter freundii]